MKFRLLKWIGNGVARRWIPKLSWDWRGRLAILSMRVAVVREEESCGTRDRTDKLLPMPKSRRLTTSRIVETLSDPLVVIYRTVVEEGRRDQERNCVSQSKDQS